MYGKSHLFVQNYSRCHKKFSKPLYLDAHFLILSKINPRLLQKLNAVLCINIVAQAKFPASNRQDLE